MKYYISFLLFGLLALMFTSCNTDDLEKDINALKDRVESFEKQIQQLNDEMNIIRVALDGNKTIADWAVNGDTYTLTLSNGEKLTLTPGVVGGNYPAIEIGENGNWIIAGKDSGIRAKAEDGEDSTVTPEFKIAANPADEGKSYWYVSYDQGETFTVVENGLAEGTASGTNPIEGAVIEGDNLKVTFGGQVYMIPIVKSLVCAINLPQGVVDGLWTVAGGGESSFTVKVNLADGDVVRVKAPVSWKTRIADNKTGSTEVSVFVTPPATSTECMITVEVTHGVNTATDQIKVRTASDSYWAEYQAGLDIMIGNVVINKYDNPGGVLLTNGGKISANGVYFVAKDATVEWTGGTSNQIIMSEMKNSSSTLNLNTTANKNMSFGQGGESILGVLIKGLKMVCVTSNYTFNTAGGTTTKRVVFDRCEVQMAAGRSLTYFSGAGSIDEFVIESCRFSVPVTTSAVNVLNYYNVADGTTYGKTTIRNNVFYSSVADKSSPFMIVTAPNANKVIGSIDVNNNTILNLIADHGSSSGYVKLPIKEDWTVKNNLVWYDVDYIAASGSTGSHIMSAFGEKQTFNSDNLANNKVFTEIATQVIWGYFRNDPKQSGFTNAITPIADTPFVDGTLQKTQGKYTIKPEYKGIGATIE